MTKQAEVICVGQAVVDCITNNWDRTQYKKNVYLAKSITLSVGGDAFNESVILTRLEHSVRLVCCLGTDIAGDLIISELRRNGLGTEGVTRLASEHTPVANIFLDTKIDRQSVTSRSATLESYLPSIDILSGYRVLSLASLFRAPLDNPEHLLELVCCAKAQGAIICADTKMPTFRKLGLEDVKNILPYIDYIFPNENEAAYFTGCDTRPEMARALIDMGVGHVVIKTGAEGCLALSQTESFTLPAFKVDAVDPTGAGDNFAAGFISTLLHGGNFYDCCLFGSATAANCVMAVGTTSGVKSRRQVEDFLRDHE